ncbi:type I restriction enzyme S subunit [Cricetibacter osteomyelitidis]|uniref:Type I restriction enzyme S subunit n=1 Tax=Cricetibacter osteomyelitidis TaxID=1521931 RepID=A0A4R2T2U7_9PAST|nr:restriction endonuclease subunit S [Cricetibacter osteomyelitidis]TCP97267.1 type I restriction enzyme S subunit [Cricetibacter osteomyelitidis]
MKAQQLKNAILQLAIQGKLVPQDPNDEPASVLLEKIQQEKAKLIAEGKIKKSKKSTDKLPFAKDDKFPFEIPENWQWVRLGEICKFNSQGAISGSDIPLNSWVLDLEDIEKQSGLLIQKKLKTSNSIKSQRNLFEKNDILYGKLRPYLNKVIIADENGFCSTEIVPLKCSEYIFNKYAQLLLMSSYFLGYSKNNSHGTKMPRFNLEKGKNFLFPLPPLAEQHRIVAKIEELLPFIDQYAKKEQELTALHQAFPQQLKKSILQAAIQGKLTEQAPNDKPASELLKHIQQEKVRLISEKKLKKPKQHSEIIIRDNIPYEIIDGVERCIADEVPFEVPKNWCWVRLGEIIILNPKNKADDALNVSFIPMKDIKDGYKNEHTFSVRKWKDIKSGFTHFQNNDIGIAKITPCFENKKSVIFKNLNNQIGAGTTELFVVRPLCNTIKVEYLLWFFKTFYFINEGIKNFTGTAGQQRISSDYIKNLLFPIPPLEEQERIINKIENLFLSINKLE